MSSALAILIVDDSPEDRAVYRRLLSQDRERQYTFLETSSGEEGLRLGRERRPDCLLLDYRLPDTDGLEFLDRLAEETADRPLPVIVLTGQGSEAVAVQAMKSGAQDYLLKSEISAEGLKRAVANAIEKVALRRKLAEHAIELARANAELTREVAERERVEAALQRTHGELEELVRRRTAELSIANVELKREIAERERAEEGRARLLVREQAARRQAEEANRIKDEFLATLSHELRTPLNAILGWAQMLRMTQLEPAVAARAYETIERNARAQAQLIDDLLDVSRIITGKLRLELGAVDLRRVIDAVYDTVRPAAEAKRIAIAVRFDPGVESAWGDADRLQQVVWNLLSNAIKFTPPDGRVEVAVSRAAGEVEIQVRDSGAGIAPEFLPYVFDRFRQADSATTRAHGGLGLGLSIARHLIELHGGTIAAESAGSGRGSVFIVRLAAQLGVAAPASVEPSAAVGGAAGAVWNDPASLAGVRVLVVEDELDTRELVVRVLERCGAEVAAAASVAEAMALLPEAGAIDLHPPHVVVSDIGMPGEDGFVLLRQLRERSEELGVGIPAIALTAYARSEDRHRALAAGFATHLAKPIEPAELVAAIARLAGL